MLLLWALNSPIGFINTLVFKIDTNKSGAPNENIVQNHLNMALLNVFYYLNARYRRIFIL